MSAETPEAPQEIQISRRSGVLVLQAPRRALISLQVVFEACGHELQVTGDLIAIGGQVVYQVVGWDAASSCLVVELTLDNRNGSEAP